MSYIENGNITYTTPLSDVGYIAGTLAVILDTDFLYHLHSQGDVKDQDTGVDKHQHVLKVLTLTYECRNVTLDNLQII